MGHERPDQHRFKPVSLRFEHASMKGHGDKETIMQFKRTLLIVLFGAAAALATTGAASADPWDAHHPRRAEVNHRLAAQDMRMNHDYRDGRITLHQARMLHAEDRMVRRQERFDARFDRGHITRADQRGLNQNENGVSRQIWRDAH